MSIRGYIRSDWEVVKKLADAGYYHGYVQEPIRRPPPPWLLHPIDRWCWNRDRREFLALEAKLIAETESD